MTENKFGLNATTIDRIISIFSKYTDIQKVIIYGSRAKGNYRVGSDIDLVILAPSFSTTELFKIENEIEDLMLPYKMDLSLFHQIENKDLIDHIQCFGIPFFFRKTTQFEK